MDKRFLLTLAAILVVVGGIFFFNKSKHTSSTNNTSNNNQSQGSNHTVGKNTKGVTFVEFGDFQCPACGQYYPIVEELKKQYADQISFQFRHFPLVQIHQNAMQGSRAAEAAGLQGKFWEMYNKLYQGQQEWSSSTDPSKIFLGYAKDVGLNTEQFKSDMASNTVGDTINADMKAGQEYGITGTPTFFIQGKKIEENPRDYAGFKKLLDQAIADQAKKQ